MAFEDPNGLREAMPQRITLDDRERLTVSGVEEVESFDENTVVMSTARGTLLVRGEELHIEQLSLDGGDLKVSGSVDSISFEERESSGKGGLWRRLLG